VSVGTRFIASREARVDNAYKEAIVHSTPEDIVLTTRVSGTPANVIETDYIRKAGVKLPWILEQLKNNPRTKKYTVPLIHYLGMKDLEKAATQATWKTVWSAGQSVGLVDSIASVREILEQMTDECMKSVQSLNHITS
jgi:nitronate monooxygenase